MSLVATLRCCAPRPVAVRSRPAAPARKYPLPRLDDTHLVQSSTSRRDERKWPHGRVCGSRPAFSLHTRRKTDVLSFHGPIRRTKVCSDPKSDLAHKERSKMADRGILDGEVLGRITHAGILEVQHFSPLAQSITPTRSSSQPQRVSRTDRFQCSEQAPSFRPPQPRPACARKGHRSHRGHARASCPGRRAC